MCVCVCVCMCVVRFLNPQCIPRWYTDLLRFTALCKLLQLSLYVFSLSPSLPPSLCVSLVFLNLQCILRWCTDLLWFTAPCKPLQHHYLIRNSLILSNSSPRWCRFCLQHINSPRVIMSRMRAFRVLQQLLRFKKHVGNFFENILKCMTRTHSKICSCSLFGIGGSSLVTSN